MSILVLDNITKEYPNGIRAVDSVCLEINDQELLILVGPSGCGKTTTLRMIAGLEDPSSGSIYIDSERVNNRSPRERNIAMVFQNYALYPHMTVYDNLAFSLKMHHMDPAKIRLLVTETAQMLGIEDILHQKPRLLSGGQQQRVALGRAIVRRPQLFLFDEPLSNLDAHLRAKMRTELSRLHTRLEATMVYVTHDQIEAMSMGEKIAVMNKGKIQQVADPITIYDRPANKFVAGFFGNPPINFFEGELVSRDNNLFFATGDLLFPIPVARYAGLERFVNRQLVMGMRPENIVVGEGKKNGHCGLYVSSSVEVIEPMGCETIVYFSAGVHDFVARFEAHTEFIVNEQAKLFFSMEKSLLFDKETEQIIL